MKRIVIIANSTWNIYNFRQELIQHLKGSGFKVSVIAPVDEYIHYLNKSYFTKHIPLRHLKAQGTNIIEDIALFFELYKILRKEKPDLILSYTIKPNIYSSLIARLLKIPCIATVTGLGSSYNELEGFSWMVGRLYKTAFRQNEFVVFHNADDKRLMLEHNLIKNAQAIVIPGSGVNTETFIPQMISSEKRFSFLFLGRLLKDKGLLEYVAAAKYAKDILKNAQFFVAGQLNETNPNSISKEQLLDWVEHRYITYLGEEKDVRKLISRCHVFVLPSYREGLPKAILEAMAMSKPIITTRAAGCIDTVEDGINGILVNPKDELELAEAMIKIYQLSVKELNVMGKASRELVIQNFSTDKILRKYDELIYRVFQNELNVSKLQEPKNAE